MSRSSSQRRYGRGAAVALGIAVACALAGCGSSTATSGHTATGHRGGAVAFTHEPDAD